MSKLPSAFKADEHKDMGFDPIPKDNYRMQVTASDYKENGNRNGHFLSLKMEVQEGDYQGRIIFRNLNLDNPNPKAVAMANEELASICRACGLPNGIEDSEELHGIDFLAKVVVKSGKGDAADQNNIQSYAPMEGVKSPNPDGVKEPSAVGGGAKSTPRKPIFEDDDE